DKRFFIESVVRKYIRQNDKVDDLIQQIFIKIYLNFRKIVSLENTNSYIYRMAVNEIMDHYKKNSAKFEVSIDSVMENLLPDKKLSFDDSIRNETILGLFHSWLLSLPRKRQAVVSLRIYEEKPFSEISEILDITEVSARNLFSIAIKSIRKKLLKMEGDHAEA
ncbi:MAG TPA: sigma-70 family RNA polymerase sigma factor, partial [bacterium]|nr:sigma-70 family RNA polymerase sigma factor [bacterium]